MRDIYNTYAFGQGLMNGWFSVNILYQVASHKLLSVLISIWDHFRITDKISIVSHSFLAGIIPLMKKIKRKKNGTVQVAHMNFTAFYMIGSFYTGTGVSDVLLPEYAIWEIPGIGHAETIPQLYEPFQNKKSLFR